MLRDRILPLLTALLCLSSAVCPALAAEVESGGVYCFSPEELAQDNDLSGICITSLPERDLGSVTLGNRQLQPGDVLTADQLARMTFSPLVTEEDLTASVTYLPICDGHAQAPVTMTISIRGKEDRAPIAEDLSCETYKNLALEGKLKVRDPEDQGLIFTVVRKPRRGEVVIREDGSFTYTPKKNKVGTDSFTYTAADPKGNVSREATVTIQLLKPTDAPEYTDTLGRDCRFAAEWMKHTGIFVGEKIGDNTCFGPEKPVSRGEFVAMLVKALELPVDASAGAATPEDAPSWLRPYLAAALRSGLTDGLPQETFSGYHAPITGAEAAVMLQNALDLPTAGDIQAMTGEAVPAWAAVPLAVMAHYDISLSPDLPLTREQAALCLYRAYRLAPEAPGITALRSVW